MRVKCRFHFAQFCKSSSPKNAGLYSARKPLPCSPTTNHRISQSAPPRHQRFASSKSLVVDRTYPVPDGRARHLRRRDRTYRSLSRGCRAAREIQQYNLPDVPAVRRYPQQTELAWLLLWHYRAGRQLFAHRIDTFNTCQLTAYLPADHTCLLAGD